MSRAEYAVVEDYATYHVGGHIVEARPCEGAALTGLLVEVEPYYVGHTLKVESRWDDIDALEHAYEKIVITTTDNQKAYMYVGKEILSETGRNYQASGNTGQRLAV